MSDVESLKARLPLVVKSAELVFRSADTTSATILYFKVWFLAIDILLLDKEGRSPKDHAERFKMLKTSFPELYNDLDKYYPIYRDTYTLNIDPKTSSEVRLYVKKLLIAFKL